MDFKPPSCGSVVQADGWSEGISATSMGKYSSPADPARMEWIRFWKTTQGWIWKNEHFCLRCSFDCFGIMAISKIQMMRLNFDLD